MRTREEEQRCSCRHRAARGGQWPCSKRVLGTAGPGKLLQTARCKRCLCSLWAPGAQHCALHTAGMM